MAWWRRWWPFLSLGAATALAGSALASSRPRLTLGAWTGYKGLLNPRDTVARARAAGLRRLDCFVNDTLSDGGRRFYTYDPGLVRTGVEIWRREGLDVGLVTWVRPEPDWCDGQGTVASLARSAGCDRASADVEEPWLTAVTDANADSWAARAVAAGRSAGLPYGSTVIVNANLARVGPYVSRCDFVVPQCYESKLNTPQGFAPGYLVQKALARYRPLCRRVIAGEYTMNLEGAFGMSADRAFAASADAAAALVDELCYWRLETLTPAQSAYLRALDARMNGGSLDG